MNLQPFVCVGAGRVCAFNAAIRNSLSPFQRFIDPMIRQRDARTLAVALSGHAIGAGFTFHRARCSVEESNLK